MSGLEFRKALRELVAIFSLLFLVLNCVALRELMITLQGLASPQPSSVTFHVEAPSKLQSQPANGLAYPNATNGKPSQPSPESSEPESNPFSDSHIVTSEPVTFI